MFGGVRNSQVDITWYLVLNSRSAAATASSLRYRTAESVVREQ
jgi:hypothetical protein